MWSTALRTLRNDSSRLVCEFQGEHSSAASGGSRISQRRVLFAREIFRATPICALATPTLIKDAQLLILRIVLDRAQGLPIDQYSFSITRR